MPRPSRNIFNGAVYHIYQRGNNRDFIFEKPAHKAFFIKQLREYNNKFDYQLLAYVVMDNHYHLLIRTNQAPIDKIMFNINNVIAKFLNRELNRTGHVYEGRYNCKLVESDAYLLWLLRYIHRNPIRAKICSTLDQYKWCSHFFYRKGVCSFVDINFILRIISDNKAQAINQYISLMEAQGHETDSKNDYQVIKEQFNLKDTSSFSNIPHTPSINRLTLDDILDLLNVSQDLKELMKNGSKTRVITQHKIQFIKNALSHKYTLVEISPFLSTSPTALSKFLSYHKICN